MRLPDDPLLRAWAALIALSALMGALSAGPEILAVFSAPEGGGAAAMLPAPDGEGAARPGVAAWAPAAAGAAAMGLGWAKARLILRRYLGLSAAAEIAAGFDLALGAACLLFAALILIPAL